MRAALADETILGEPTEYELLCLELVDTVERSEGLAEYSAVQVIQQAAKDGSWQAAAWMLERRYPDDYARTTKQRHAGHDGKAVTISVQDFQRHKEQAAREVDDLESAILNGGV